MTTKAAIMIFAACATSCSAPPARHENWAYLGNDVALKSPPLMRNGDATDPVWRAEAQEKIAVWQQKIREAVESAKTKCSAETGVSKSPDFLSGYPQDFMACMKKNGWGPRFSNPL